MKKIIFICLFIVTAMILGVSDVYAAESANVRIELHSFTQTQAITNATTFTDGLDFEVSPQFSTSGHSYTVFYNIGTTDVMVGYYTLKPGKKVSVGLWTAGGASSSSSSSGSSSGSFGNHNGVYYELERVKFSLYETPQNDVCIRTYITESQLLNATNRIKNKNDSYDALTYNCSSLAVDVWNYATGDNLSAGWINTPDYLRTNIINNGDFTVYYNYSIGSSNKAYWYKTSNNTMMEISFT